MRRRRLEFALAAALVLSLAIKVAVHRPEMPGSDLVLPQRLTALVEAAGFENVQLRDEDRLMTANRQACEILVARLSPDGSQLEAFRRVAPAGSELSIVDDNGRKLRENHLGRLVDTALDRIGFYFALPAARSSRLLIIKTPTCEEPIFRLD